MQDKNKRGVYFKLPVSLLMDLKWINAKYNAQDPQKVRNRTLTEMVYEALKEYVDKQTGKGGK